MRLVRLTLLLWFLCGAAHLAQASGLILTPSGSPPARILSQTVLIRYEPSRERLMPETVFAAEGSRFAWLLPVPAVPTVDSAAPEILPALAPMFQPEWVDHVRPWWLYIAWAAAAGAAVWRAAKSRRPAHLLLAMVLLAVGAVSFFRPATPPVGAGQRSNAVPESGSRAETLEMNAMTILEPTDFSELQGWAEDEGFPLPATALPMLGEYVRQQWVFVVLRASRPSPGDGPVVFPSVALEFPTSAPVLPLALSEVAESPGGIDLFVFGPGRAAATGFRTRRCSRPIYSDAALDSGPEWRPGPLRVISAPLREFVESAPVATRLRVEPTPGRLPQDARIRFYDFEGIGEKVYTRPAAATLAANVSAFALLGCGLILASLRGRAGPRYPWSATVARLLFVALGVGALTFWMTPKADTPRLTPVEDTPDMRRQDAEGRPAAAERMGDTAGPRGPG